MDAYLNNINLAAHNNAPQVDKEKILRMSHDEKLLYLDNIRINYPKMNDIIKEIDKCHESTKTSARPKCMSISGPSGSGKTTFYEIHAKKYPDIEKAEGIEKPILYSRIPCPARISGLAPAILHDMEDMFWNKRSDTTTQTRRLYDLIKDCKVQMIFFDEVQHLVDRNSERLIRDSSDWFKNLIDSVKIPIVFMGMPDSKKIFIENDQLANRVKIHNEVGPFKYSDSTFRKILYLFDISLPLKNISDLAESDMSKRIFIATKGLMKHIHDIIVEAATLSLENKLPMISMPIFAQAYENILSSKNQINPFLPGFDLNDAIEKLQIKGLY